MILIPDKIVLKYLSAYSLYIKLNPSKYDTRRGCFPL